MERNGVAAAQPGSPARGDRQTLRGATPNPRSDAENTRTRVGTRAQVGTTPPSHKGGDPATRVDRVDD